MAAAAASSARSRRVRQRFTVKLHRRDSLDVVHLLGWRLLPVAGLWCLVWSDLSRLAIEKKLNSVSGLESYFLKFLELKEFLGARVSFGIPNYIYIGSRVDFG